MENGLNIGDETLFCSLGYPNVKVQIIGETKKYWRIDLSSVPKENGWTMGYDKKEGEAVKQESALFHKTKGHQIGSNSAEASRYCPPFIATSHSEIERINKIHEHDEALEGA